MSEFYKTKLNKIASSVRNLDDLMPILQCISLDKVQSFVKQTIDQMDESIANGIHLKLSSIDDVIPKNSFNTYYHFGDGN